MRLILGAETPETLEDLWILYRDDATFSAAPYIGMGYVRFDAYVVGGGAAGNVGGKGWTAQYSWGASGGGGGGGGGFNKQEGQFLATLPAAVPVVVGAGGTVIGAAGQSSSFNGIGAYGGGGCGPGGNASIHDTFAGSGGGGGGVLGPGGTATGPNNVGGATGLGGGGKGATAKKITNGVLQPSAPSSKGTSYAGGWGGGGGGAGGIGRSKTMGNDTRGNAIPASGGYLSAAGNVFPPTGDAKLGWAGAPGPGGGGANLTALTGQPGLEGSGDSGFPGGGGMGGYETPGTLKTVGPYVGGRGCVLIRIYV